MGVESTHANHLTFQAVNLDILPIIIIAYLKQESKSVDKEVSYW